MRTLFICLALLAATATVAQDEEVTAATGGEIRVLDKLTGEVTDLALQVDEIGQIGFLTVKLTQCRYPTSNPSGDAFVHVQVSYRNDPTFAGWILASAPALNAMDHPRYDVWALRCMTS